MKRSQTKREKMKAWEHKKLTLKIHKLIEKNKNFEWIMLFKFQRMLIYSPASLDTNNNQIEKVA